MYERWTDAQHPGRLADRQVRGALDSEIAKGGSQNGRSNRHMGVLERARRAGSSASTLTAEVNAQALRSAHEFDQPKRASKFQ